VIPAALGVSRKDGLTVNSVAIPRTPGEAVGGIVRLVGNDREFVVNVEYNQLDALLRSTNPAEGDLPNATGESPYPGNTNILVMDLAGYVEALARTGGLVPEFVNPKYANPERTRFKRPARLECMMQDFPKLLGESARVAYTQFGRSLCFSPVKNNIGSAREKAQQGLPPESAASAEADLYAVHRRILAQAGASVEEAPPVTFSGLSLDLFPVVVLSPKLATPSVPRWKAEGATISGRSVLILDCDDLRIESLTLDGALIIRGVPGARIVVKGLTVFNAGWQAKDSAAPGELRGFTWERAEARVIEFDTPGEHVVTA
jgi:UDP-sugar pyrophosphorylase